MFESKMSKIATAWTITIVTGMTLFYYSRQSIVQRRQRDMQARKRARQLAAENQNIVQTN